MAFPKIISVGQMSHFDVQKITPIRNRPLSLSIMTTLDESAPMHIPINFPYTPVSSSTKTNSLDGQSISSLDEEKVIRIRGTSKLNFESGKNEITARKNRKNTPAAEKEMKELDEIDEKLRTTVMMRNIPLTFSQKDVLDVLHHYEYMSYVDFIYVPIDFTTKNNFGYAFINFVEPEDAFTFKTMFEGFQDWTCGIVPSPSGSANPHAGAGGAGLVQEVKKCTVSWNSLQGVQSQIEKYRNSSVMHELVPEEYKPILLKDGEAIHFPLSRHNLQIPKKFLKALNQNNTETQTTIISVQI